MASIRWGRGAPVPVSAWRCCSAPGTRAPDTFTGHRDVLAAAIRQVPARFRRQVLVGVDGAGASHELVKHLLALSSPRRKCSSPAGG